MCVSYWSSRYCGSADAVQILGVEGRSSSTGCSFFFMISPLSIMIFMVSLQSTNGIFVIWHYEEQRFRGKEFGLQTNGICIYLYSICTKANMLIYSEI